MGQAERQKESKRDAKRQRNISPARKVSAEDIDPTALLECLQQVLQVGGAVRIGRTRDGGAWAFGIYGDGSQPYTEYVRSEENVNDYLIDLRRFFETLEGP